MPPVSILRCPASTVAGPRRCMTAGGATLSDPASPSTRKSTLSCARIPRRLLRVDWASLASPTGRRPLGCGFPADSHRGYRGLADAPPRSSRHRDVACRGGRVYRRLPRPEPCDALPGSRAHSRSHRDGAGHDDAPEADEFRADRRHRTGPGLCRRTLCHPAHTRSGFGTAHGAQDLCLTPPPPGAGARRGRGDRSAFRLVSDQSSGGVLHVSPGGEICRSLRCKFLPAHPRCLAVV